MTVNKELLNFSVVVYGDISQYNAVLSKARCRIFYKGANRNGTYITDEFADKLLSSAPYAPIKGIYDHMEGDYTDHGRERYEGRIYGIVPENPNASWEAHLDEDGVTRTYACVDVLLFTGIYKDEAYKIVGKSQSMEIYGDSIKGEWKYIDGKKYFVFDEGCFLGLQALGDDVEPCFEGAAFFTMVDKMNYAINQINKFNSNFEDNNGGKEMFNFKLSDNQKYNMIWSLLNPNFNEEGGWEANYCITDVYDEYALTFNIKESIYERAYYVKSDASDSLEITGKEVAYIMDVTEKEKNALSALRTMNGDTYEAVDEKFGRIAELEEENSNFSQKIEECNASITTLTEERDNFQSELEDANNNYSVKAEEVETLTQENASLKEFKHNIEVERKEAIIDSYIDKLDAEILNSYREQVEDFSETELDKELAFTLVKTKPALFNHEPEDAGLIPKEEPELKGIEGILSRYEK